MLGKGKDKKIIDAITCLRETENTGGSPELVSIHTRLLSGRAAFEGILTKTMTSAMSISNLDLQVSDRVEELEGLSENLLGAASDLNHISAEAALVTKQVAAALIFWPSPLPKFPEIRWIVCKQSRVAKKTYLASNVCRRMRKQILRRCKAICPHCWQ